MLTHLLLVNYWDIFLHSFTNNELEIVNTAASCGIELSRSFVQVNPDNSLAECVNL